MLPCCPEEMTCWHEEITCCPEEMTCCPQETTCCPEEMTCCPEEMTCCPEETTCCPEETTCCPEEATCCPEEMACCPEETTCCPEEATCCPEEATCCPEEMTCCPEETTCCPEETTNQRILRTPPQNFTRIKSVGILPLTKTGTAQFLLISTKQSALGAESPGATAGRACTPLPPEQGRARPHAESRIPNADLTEGRHVGLADEPHRLVRRTRGDAEGPAVRTTHLQQQQSRLKPHLTKFSTGRLITKEKAFSFSACC